MYILAEPPSLQVQHKGFCRMSASPTHSPLLLSRRLTAGSEKENQRRSPSRVRSSAPTALVPKMSTGKRDFSPHSVLPSPFLGLNMITTDFTSPDARRLRNRTFKIKHTPLRPSDRLHFRQIAASSRSISFRVSSAPNSTVSTIEGLPSPLVRSSSLLKDSARITDIFHSTRSSIISPPVSRARSVSSIGSGSFLADHTFALVRKAEASSTRHAVNVHPVMNSMSLAPSLPTKIDLLKEELTDAKERYTQALEKVKSHLTLVEQKYKDRPKAS